MAIVGNLTFGTAEIKVSPDMLLSAASEVQSKTNNMRQSFEAMRTHIQKTKGYWRGEAGDHHRNLYEKQQSEIDSIISLLSERVRELEQMASNYATGEQKATSTAQQLATNVIEF